MEPHRVLGSSVQGLVYLIFRNVLTHALTFVLNTLLIRHLDTSLFGFATVQLELLVTTVLFLSREAFRNTCQRSDPKEVENEWKVTNLSWLCVPLGMAVTAATLGFSFASASEEERSLPYYHAVMLITALAAFIELLSEPLYILTLRHHIYGPRVTVESLATFIRCITNFCLAFFFPQLGALSFAFSWLFYSLTITIGYYLYFFVTILLQHPEYQTFPLSSFNEMFPRFVHPLRWTQRESIVLWVHFLWQSLEMYVLTEGQKHLIKYTMSLVNQGLFSLVNNLGSLAARFIFLPVEQVSAALFSQHKTLGLRKSSEVLTLVLKLMLLIGLLFISFGPNYSFTLLDRLYTKKYSVSEAPYILGWYCIYVAFMALNGVSEAFMRAVASPKDMKVYNGFLILFAAVYVAVAIVFIQQWRTVGLILAECCNMAMRITFCLHFMHRFFNDNYTNKNQKEDALFSLSACLPSSLVLVSFLWSFFITRFSSIYFCGDISQYSLFSELGHITIGSLCLLSILFTIALTERKFMAKCRELWALRRSPSKTTIVTPDDKSE
ncbi:Oligosaccharide translocation protein rft1 [Balamuthia mandrillaris]